MNKVLLKTRDSKGRFLMGRKVYHTPETRQKIRETLTGKKFTKARIEKIRLAATGKSPTLETRQKMSLAKMGNTNTLGYVPTLETKQKMRESALRYIQRTCGSVCPRLGKNEEAILNFVEQKINYKILRQFRTCGYFLDGYVPELKLAIEVDELPKTKKKDTEREIIISKELNCLFLRIKDYA